MPWRCQRGPACEGAGKELVAHRYGAVAHQLLQDLQRAAGHGLRGDAERRQTQEVHAQPHPVTASDRHIARDIQGRGPGVAHEVHGTRVVGEHCSGDPTLPHELDNVLVSVVGGAEFVRCHADDMDAEALQPAAMDSPRRFSAVDTAGPVTSTATVWWPAAATWSARMAPLVPSS